MALKLSNNAVSKLASSLTAGATSFAVMPGDGAKFPTLAAGDWFPLTVVKSDGTMEIMRCTARATDTLTVTRAQESTAAVAFAAGDRVELRWTAGAFNDLLANANSRVARAGDTMTGPLYFQAYNGSVNGFEVGTGDGASYGTYNVALRGWYGLGMRSYDNAVNGYYDFRVGKWDVKGGFFVNGVRTWDNTNFDPNTKLNKAGDIMTDRFTLARNGWQADLQLTDLRAGFASSVYLRSRGGGGLEIINSAYSAVPWQVSDAGETWQNNNLHVGDAQYQTDGNIIAPAMPYGNLYAALNAKATAGARVQWDSGIAEFDYVGSVNSNINGQIDLPAPWVVTGLRVNASTSAITAIWQRGVVLRNQ